MGISAHAALISAPPHYQQDVRVFLDEKLQGHCIGRRGTIEFPPRSPDLTPLDFYLWGTLKDVVYRKKPATLGDLRAEIPINTLRLLNQLLTVVIGV